MVTTRAPSGLNAALVTTPRCPTTTQLLDPAPLPWRSAQRRHSRLAARLGISEGRAARAIRIARSILPSRNSASAILVRNRDLFSCRFGEPVGAGGQPLRVPRSADARHRETAPHSPARRNRVPRPRAASSASASFSSRPGRNSRPGRSSGLASCQRRSASSRRRRRERLVASSARKRWARAQPVSKASCAIRSGASAISPSAARRRVSERRKASQLEAAQILRRRRVGRPADEGCERPHVANLGLVSELSNRLMRE